MSRIVLQKFLHSGMSQMVRERGYDQVGGFVTEASAAAVLRTPDAVRSAYGLADDGVPFLDVVRFLLPACARLDAPAAVERPWPTYPAGFLFPVGEDLVPVWKLSTTRYSPGAEVWRIHADGSQEMVSAYGGVARGWSSAREWRPASRYYGTRAVWGGVEYAADVAGQDVTLTSFVAVEGEGWTQTRPSTWSRSVPVTECDVYELDFAAEYEGVSVRVLEVIGGEVRLQVNSDDVDTVSRLGAHMIDFGVFERPGVSGELLTSTRLTADQLQQ